MCRQRRTKEKEKEGVAKRKNPKDRWKSNTPVLWPLDVKSWLFWKDPNAGKDWRQKEKETTEDEMVGWHHQLDGHEFEQAPGVGNGQGSLVCCSPWSHEESDMTEQLNWTPNLFFPHPFTIAVSQCLFCI